MKFFDKKLSKCIYKFRSIILILCFIWLFLSMYFGYHISSQSTEESMLSKSLPIQQAKDIIDFMIGKEDDYIHFNFYFGVEPKLHEFNETSFWNRTLTGLPVFDRNFDLSPPKNQMMLKDFCAQI